IEPFGGDSYVVKAVPAMIAHLGAEAIMRDIFAQLAGGSGSSVTGRVEGVLSTMACKAAIKAGQRMQLEEMVELLRQMGEAKIFSHCPHGRPVMKYFSGGDIRRWFHRG
ncbi:MAG: DNA mismatch repair protein MutL, partial [Desulfobulbaceae bacterium]|nr:DNA mismatch repair protein MutL [Desulfobulbaceae bacterium]